MAFAITQFRKTANNQLWLLKSQRPLLSYWRCRWTLE